MKKFKLPLSVKIFIALFIVGTLYSISKSLYTTTTSFYNNTIVYSAEYVNCEQAQVTTWDNNYLAFNEKFNIADINKETFLTVTNIIMSARKDGANLAWKWNTENQQIPYEEFTVFYKELSTFVATRYAENNAIELRKQNIVKQHNVLISTFPGVLYNYFLHTPPLVYKEGFVSIDTQNLFKK